MYRFLRTVIAKYHDLGGLKLQKFLFFFFSFIFISWRLITLQYCSGFCLTLTWISHGFTCIPHPDPHSHLPPTRSLWVFPVHQVRALDSCIQPGLVICKTTEISFHTVLEDRSPNVNRASSFWGHRDNPFQACLLASVRAGNPSHSLACICFTSISVSVLALQSPYVYVQISLFLRTPIMLD